VTEDRSIRAVAAALAAHRFRSVAARQHAGAVAEHDEPIGILLNATSIDRTRDRQIIVTVEDLLDAGAFTAGAEKLDAKFCRWLCSLRPALDTFQKQHHPQPDDRALDVATGCCCFDICCDLAPRRERPAICWQVPHKRPQVAERRKRLRQWPLPIRAGRMLLL